MSREWKLYFDDMVSFCDKVIFYTNGLNKEAFEASGLTFDATLWNVQLIGEAAKNIPDDIRLKIDGVPWRELIGTRNRIIHGYFGINNSILWHIVSVEVPKIRGLLQQFASTHNELFRDQA
jgi:uncharacterized protein with HEPN domain